MTPQTLAQEAGTLFSLPQAALRVNELLRHPEHTARELAEVVELDTGLTARVLRLANSPLFGHAGRIEKISSAIVMIGERSLRDLVMVTSVTQAFKGIPEEFADMSSFWDNSATCGVVARLLAERLGIQEGERLFVAGMLHGIGRLVFYSRQPERYREVLKARSDGEAAVVEAERRAFGFSYADLGAALMRTWHMPEFFQVVIGHQLDTTGAEPYRKEATILHLALDMAESLAPSIKAGEAPATWPAAGDPVAAEYLGLEAEALESIRFDALAQAFEVIEIINPGATTIY